MTTLLLLNPNMNYMTLLFVNFNEYILWFNLCIVFFSVGLFGAIHNNQHFLHVLLNFEIMLIGIVLTYVGFSILFSDPKGQIYALVIFVIATAEACVGLALSLSYFRNMETVDLYSTSETNTQQ